MAAAFVPSHTAPPGGLPAWAAPDPRALTVATIQPRVEMRILQRYGTWAQIECANGWTAWVDGGRLVPVPPPNPAPTQMPIATSAPPPAPSYPGYPPPPAAYQTPSQSYAAQQPSYPPPQQTPYAQAPGYPQQAGYPAQPGYGMPRQRYPATPQAPVSVLRRPLIRLGRYGVTLWELIPAVGIALGSLLPWLGGEIGSGTSFDVPLLLLFGTQPGAADLKVGFLLAAAVLIGMFVPLASIRLLAFGLALAVCVLYFVQLQRALSEAGGAGEIWSFIGFGVYVTAGAAIVGCIGCLLPRRQ